MLKHITIQEESMINYSRSNYGEYSITALEFLAEWERQKPELYKLFNENLILEKTFSYNKAEDELANELSDLLNTRTCLEEKVYGGVEFYTSIYQHIWGTYRYDHSIAERDGLSILMGDESLLTNRYNDRDFTFFWQGRSCVIQKGSKTSKALARIADLIGAKGSYEWFRIGHSQILNQRKVQGTLCLSIHPLDYITMSDNDCGWESCMSWDQDGGYKQGTIEMMNSPCVVVAYLKDRHDMRLGSHYWNSKKWRQLFIVKPELIFGIKSYPYFNEELSNTVAKWLRELAIQNWNAHLSEPFEYKYETDINVEGVESFRIRCFTDMMYNDCGHATTHTVCVDYDAVDDRRIIVDYSGPSMCISCGALNPCFEDASNLTCNDCADRYTCDECGETICGEDAMIIGDCRLCYGCWESSTTQCSLSHERCFNDDMTLVVVLPRLTTEQAQNFKNTYNERYGWLDRTAWKENSEVNYGPTNDNIIAFNADKYDIEDWEYKYLNPNEEVHYRQSATLCGDNYVYVYFDQLNQEGRAYLGCENISQYNSNMAWSKTLTKYELIENS